MALVTCVAVALLGGACSGPPESSTDVGGAVSALYAGSLAAVMEDGLGPAFTAETGLQFRGEAHGSLGAAQLIRDRLREPDVFVSADPVVNEIVLMGPRNDDLVDWYVTFASSQMVIAYSPESDHVEDFEAVAAGDAVWHEVLANPDVSFGRGDPSIDPKGYRTLFMFDLAGEFYDDPTIPALLGDPLNPDQVLPEVSLLARVDAGQFDAGIFYEHEAVATGLPYLTLPPEIHLGDPSFAESYATTSYQVPDGELVDGAPILFTVTIPTTAKDQRAAEEFVHFLLTSPDQIEALGFGSTDLEVTGDADQAPARVRGLL